MPPPESVGVFGVVPRVTFRTLGVCGVVSAMDVVFVVFVVVVGVVVVMIGMDWSVRVLQLLSFNNARTGIRFPSSNSAWREFSPGSSSSALFMNRVGCAIGDGSCCLEILNFGPGPGDCLTQKRFFRTAAAIDLALLGDTDLDGVRGELEEWRRSSELVLIVLRLCLVVP